MFSLIRLPLTFDPSPPHSNLNPVYFSSPRARRAAKEAKEAPAQPAPEKVKVEVKKFVKIGRPGYKGTSLKYCNCNRFRIKCLLSLHKCILFILFLFFLSNETEGSRDGPTESTVSGYIIGASVYRQINVFWNKTWDKEVLFMTLVHIVLWAFSFSDWLSWDCRGNWTQTPLHVCVWAAYRASRPSLAVSAPGSWALRNHCV